MSFAGRLLQRATERAVRVPSAEIGAMADASPGSLWKFVAFLPFSRHRRRTPAALFSAARFVATCHEDCGSCRQIAVNLALDDGVPVPVMRALVEGRHDALPEDVQLAVRFAEGVLARDGSDAGARDAIIARFGPAVLTELAIVVATARVFPTLKRGLGHAVTCSLVPVRWPD